MNEKILDYKIKFGKDGELDPNFLTFGDCRYDNIYIVCKLFNYGMDMDSFLLSRIRSFNLFVSTDNQGKLVDIGVCGENESEYIDILTTKNVDINRLKSLINKFGYAIVETVSPFLPFSRDFNPNFKHTEYLRDYHSFVLLDYDDKYYYYIRDSNLVDQTAYKSICGNSEIGIIDSSVLDNVFKNKLDVINFSIDKKFNTNEKIKKIWSGIYNYPTDYSELKSHKDEDRIVYYGNEAYNIMKLAFSNLNIFEPSLLYPYKTMGNFCLWKLNSVKNAHKRYLNWFTRYGESVIVTDFANIINKYTQIINLLMKGVLLDKHFISLSEPINDIIKLEDHLAEKLISWKCDAHHESLPV